MDNGLKTITCSDKTVCQIGNYAMYSEFLFLAYTISFYGSLFFRKTNQALNFQKIKTFSQKKKNQKYFSLESFVYPE